MANDSALLERIDDVEAFVSAPGKYHTTTGHQAYGVLQALDGHPYVKLGEELYFTEGSILFAEVSPVRAMTPNVEKIAWGTEPDFFERRLRDYDAWEVAFWRELLQNSRDAGATRIDIRCEPGRYEDPESGESIECVVASSSDDGRGMDQETLMRAFFRRGGSQKDVGSVGGFGDAKNLILTPWLGYEVRTQDVRARGRHEDIFAPIETGLPPIKGTAVTVWMPSTKATTAEYAQFLIEQSSLDLTFTINGKRVDQRLPRGQVVMQKPINVGENTVGELIVYHSPRAKRKGIYVRSHGIYMYEVHGYSADYKGVITVEVNAPPINVFTTKRDALSYTSNARAELNSFLGKLGADPKQLLKKVRDKKEVIFRGAGAIEVRRGRVSELAAQIAEKVDLSRFRTGSGPDGGPVKLDKKAADRLLNEFTVRIGRLEDEDEDEPLGPTVSPLASTFGTLLTVGNFVNVEQVVGAMKLSMWKPDFFLYQNISPWKMPKTLHPETMALKYHQLLQVWTEVCKFVLVQFGMFQPFGVGWVFDSEYTDEGESVIAAAFKKHEQMDWLLLNPVKIKREGYGDDISFELEGDRFALAENESLERLVSYAVHEITHMQGFMSHNDSYSSALTTNMKVIFRLAPVLNRIVKEAKKAVSEERPVKKAAQSPASARLKALLPTSTIDPRFRALYALFAAAQGERARAMFEFSFDHYRKRQAEFEESIKERGYETAWIWEGERFGASGGGDDFRFKRALRVMIENIARARGGQQRVVLPPDPTFMSWIRWAGDEAWYAAIGSAGERTEAMPRVDEESFSLLLQVMSEVYDLTPLAKWWAAWQAA